MIYGGKLRGKDNFSKICLRFRIVHWLIVLDFYVEVFLYQINMFVLEKHNIIKRKLFWGFKYIRFKSSLKLLPETNSKVLLKLRTCALADILNCTNHTAQNIISRNRNILTSDSESFIRNAKFCSKYLKLSDLVEFPYLMSLNSSLLQHRYFSLVELGCSNISASNILKFLQIVKKTPKMLQKEGVHVSYEKNLDYCMDFLSDSDKDMKLAIKSRIKNMYEDGSTLWKIKEAMNAEIFASKLNCSISKTHHMFHRYPPLRLQSIGNTLKLLDILFQQYKFPVSKTFYSPTLLSLHHEVLENFFEKVPHILGVSTVELIQKLPLLLRRSVNSTHKIERILQDFNITNAQLLSCPKILTFSSHTLQDRLESLCKSEVLGVWKSNKKFLWLVYYFHRLNPRLEVLKAFNLPCSISIITASNAKFDNYLCYDGCRNNTQDICHYLSETLDCNKEDVLAKLCEFPYLETSSLTNCCKVVEFLLNSNISKKQLFNGLGIIFYDISIVTIYFNDLNNHPRCQPFSEWISHYNLIQLLIYVIEVDNGFRGNRSNVTERRSDDSEELSLSGFAF